MKSDQILKILLTVGGGILIGKFLADRFLKNEKRAYDNSKLSGQKADKRALFTLTNNTANTQSIRLFDTRGGSGNSNLKVSGNLEFFTRDITGKPKKLKTIEFRSVSGNAKQVEQPFQMVCKDASGNEQVNQMLPLESSMQMQKGMTGVSFPDFILDGECYMNYSVLPNSSLHIVVYYQDL